MLFCVAQQFRICWVQKRKTIFF